MTAFKLFAALAFSMIALSVQAPAAAKDLGWADLIDLSAQNFEDPYLDLSYEQIDALRTIFLSRQSLAAASLSAADRSNLQAKLSEAQTSLTDAGHDPDWLIEQRWIVAELRERAATAGNPGVDGQVITLAGFALAGPPAEDGTPVAYLVPERGMCSHMPPPNPNQMIRVRIHDGWTPSYAHEPVRLTGKISIAPTNEVFHIVDGPVEMRATFVMETENVETIADMRAQADPEATREWAQQMAERLRASDVQLHSDIASSK